MIGSRKKYGTCNNDVFSITKECLRMSDYTSLTIIVLLFIILISLFNIGIILSKSLKAQKDLERALYRLIEVTKERH